MTEPGRRLRVLALHSFRTSGEIFREQMRRAKLDQTLGDLLEIVYIDAPHAASGPPPIDVKGRFEKPFYEWFVAKKAGHAEVAFEFNGLEESEAYISHILSSKGPFDGIMGFSQGCVMASSLIAMQQHGTALQDAPKLKFGIFYAGAMTNHHRHLEAMEAKVDVPSLHIFGSLDYIKDHCIELVRRFSNPLVLIHPRGHVIPEPVDYHLAAIRAFLATQLKRPRL